MIIHTLEDISTTLWKIATVSTVAPDRLRTLLHCKRSWIIYRQQRGHTFFRSGRRSERSLFFQLRVSLLQKIMHDMTCDG
eukprot:SAG25_NODE_121_length_14652_cov_9.937607_2_plen_80_part_00